MKDYDRERLEHIRKHTALALEHAKLMCQDQNDEAVWKRMEEIEKEIAELKAIEATWPEFQCQQEEAAAMTEEEFEQLSEEEQEQLLDNFAFEMPDWSEEFKALAKETSDFIKALPLSNEQNDQLVQYMIESVLKAKQEGFSHGLGVGAGWIEPRIREVNKVGDCDA